MSDSLSSRNGSSKQQTRTAAGPLDKYLSMNRPAASSGLGVGAGAASGDSETAAARSPDSVLTMFDTLGFLPLPDAASHTRPPSGSPYMGVLQYGPREAFASPDSIDSTPPTIPGVSPLVAHHTGAMSLPLASDCDSASQDHKQATVAGGKEVVLEVGMTFPSEAVPPQIPCRAAGTRKQFLVQSAHHHRTPPLGHIISVQQSTTASRREHLMAFVSAAAGMRELNAASSAQRGGLDLFFKRDSALHSLFERALDAVHAACYDPSQDVMSILKEEILQPFDKFRRPYVNSLPPRPGSSSLSRTRESRASTVSKDAPKLMEHVCVGLVGRIRGVANRYRSSFEDAGGQFGGGEGQNSYLNGQESGRRDCVAVLWDYADVLNSDTEILWGVMRENYEPTRRQKAFQWVYHLVQMIEEYREKNPSGYVPNEQYIRNFQQMALDGTIETAKECLSNDKHPEWNEFLNGAGNKKSGAETRAKNRASSTVRNRNNRLRQKFWTQKLQRALELSSAITPAVIGARQITPATA